MIASSSQTPTFFGPNASDSDLVGSGFRRAGGGVHASRTIMLEELRETLDAVADDADRAVYTEAILIENIAHKATTASRKKAVRFLSELYGLDPRLPIFRVLKRVWKASPDGRPLAALLCALARDPRLRSTAPIIIGMPDTAELQRDSLRAAVASADEGRLNADVIGKVVRNVASSWQQSGHLAGRTFKKRRIVRPTTAVVAFAAFLAHRSGFRGIEIFRSGWFQALDMSPAQARAALIEAKQIGLIDFRVSGEVMTLGFDRLDPAGKME